MLTHTGRLSGHTYQTPLDAHLVDDGYIFVLVYGSRSDWVKNTLAAGGASLRIGGEAIDLDAPRLVTKDAAWQQLPATTKVPPKLLRVTEFLHMNVSVGNERDPARHVRTLVHLRSTSLAS